MALPDPSRLISLTLAACLAALSGCSVLETADTDATLSLASPKTSDKGDRIAQDYAIRNTSTEKGDRLSAELRPGLDAAAEADDALPAGEALAEAATVVELPQTLNVIPTPSQAPVQLAYADPGAGAAQMAIAAQAEAFPVAPPPPDAQQVAALQQALEASVPVPEPAPQGPVRKVASLVSEETEAAGSLARSALSAVGIGEPESPRDEVDRLIEKYAQVYDLPVSFVRRVVKRESNFRANAYNRGHWGLMQIKHATARGMGYKGSAKGLLDPETNLKYAVKYLRGAWLVADGNEDHADKLYQRGYYYDAKRKGLLDETGLGKDRRRRKI